MSYIDASGKFHKDDPKMAELVPKKTSIWKQSDHDRQRREHKAELIRPYLPSGEPNPAFIEQYPVESQEIYKFIPTDEELRKEK